MSPSLVKLKKSAQGKIYVPVNTPAQATPPEILEAKMDGVCPRCERKGDFTDDAGRCAHCGFAY